MRSRLEPGKAKIMRIKWLIVVGAALFLLMSGISFVLHAADDAQAAAAAMVNRFVDSWNRADGTAYGENYWPEAELVNPSGAISSGKDAIVREHVELWAGIFKGTRATGKVRRIQRLGLNYMVVDIDVEISGVQQPPPGSPPNANGVLRNHLKHIMEKRNGVWKILSAQNTFIAVP
jgi:uncharacterized protein (TIGR02246 family)